MDGSHSQSTEGAAGNPEMLCLAYEAGAGAEPACAIAVPSVHEVHFVPVSMGSGDEARHYLCVRESDGAASAVYGDGDFMGALGLCGPDVMERMVNEDEARRLDPGAVLMGGTSMCAEGMRPVLRREENVIECVAHHF